MSILWRAGSGTVSEVRAALADRLAYTTVLWALQTLEEKGRVRHEKEGRAYRYYPVLEPEAAGGSALGRLVDKVFHGSASMLLAQLVSERGLPPGELRRMRDLLDRRLSEEEEEP
jgi:predicted transcriptional regulator